MRFIPVIPTVFCCVVLLAVDEANRSLMRPIYGLVGSYLFRNVTLLCSWAAGVVLARCTSAYLLSRLGFLITIVMLFSNSQPGLSIMFRASQALGPIYGPAMTSFLYLASMSYVMAEQLRPNFQYFWAFCIGAVLLPLTFRFHTVLDFLLLPGAFLVSLALSLFSVARAKGEPRRKLLKLITISLIGSTMLSLNSSHPPQPSLPWPTSNKQSPRLLYSRKSVTGVISVIEYYFQQTAWVRVMRADHSLLGGLWIGPTRDQVLQHYPNSPTTQNNFEQHTLDSSESIFVTFYLQEAIRLTSELENEVENKSALVIGLGIGTAAKALMRHRVRVAIAEIDPAVYECAQKFFGLPTPDDAYIEDARAVLDRREGPFDYILHDVFTGGAVPSSLFTVETWQSIKENLTPAGVLAVNFAGRIDSKAGLMILRTLLDAFTICRAFEESKDHSQMHKNMVIFCTMAQSLNFRGAVEQDYLQTPNRRFIFDQLPQLEYDLHQENITSGLLLFDANHTVLAKEQRDAALEHWHILRNQFAQDFWLAY